MEHDNEIFVGRERQKGEFRLWLNNKSQDAPWILSVYDALTDPKKQGGVGKTWLLQQFSAIAKEVFPKIVIARVDFFNIADRDGIVVAQSVVAALKDAYPEWDTSNAQKSLEKYSNALHRQEEISDARGLFADALMADFHVLNEKLGDAGRRILILFDTFELLEENPLTAALRLDQSFPDDYDFSNIGVVIAGRHKIDFNHSNWRGREHEVQNMPVSPFTLSEVREYFAELATVDLSLLSDSDVQALYERTEGRPILIGLVNDVLTQRKMTLKELISIPKQRFYASLVAKISGIGNPIDEIVLYMAHAFHRFNRSLLNWIWISPELNSYDPQNIDLEGMTQELLRLSFVRRPGSGEDFVLHDEMVPLVKLYSWDEQDPDRRMRMSISESVIKYYNHELQHEQSEQLKQAYTVELLYHKLYVDLENGYTYFSEKFSGSVNLRLNSFSRSLLHEVRKFKERMLPTQLYDLKLGEARLLVKEEAAARALNLFLELEQEADQQWLEEHRADILREKGVAYQQLGRYAEAIESFSSSGDIENKRGNKSEYAYNLNWIGSVHQKQGHLDTALRYYEDGLSIHKDLHKTQACATALLSISNVYRLQGKVEEALRRAQTALHIRNGLFKQGKISEVYVGNCLRTIGMIHRQANDLSSAYNYFQDALDIFTRTGNKKGLADIYNQMGKLSMDQGALPYAQNWCEKAHSTALNIDAGQQIYSLNKLGWICILQEQYEKGIDYLQQAIDLAKKVHDDYQQAESMVDLAEALKRSDRDEESRQVLRDARQICQQYHYYYLLGVSSSSEGDILYDAQKPEEAFVVNYDAQKLKEAFVNYAQACYYMTQYNLFEYHKVLRKLNEKLLEVPPQEINPIVDELVAYWSSQGLDKSQPDFISSCEEVRGILGF